MISLKRLYHRTSIYLRDYIFDRNKSSEIVESKTQEETSTTSRRGVYNSILSNPLESYFLTAVKLLIWEQPYLSAFAFVTLNIFYWLIVAWNRRFFSILSIFWIFLFLYKSLHDFCWPNVTVPSTEKEATGSYSLSDASRITNDIMVKMSILFKDVWKLRKENRGLFCSLMCGFFSFLAFVGRIFPGVLIVYVIVLCLTLGPGIMLHLIPETLFEQFNGFFSESESRESPATTSDRDSDLEEFIPELSATNLRQLSLNEDGLGLPSLGQTSNQDSLLIPEFGEESLESEDLSLYQGLGSFPSVEEENESDLDEDNSDKIVLQKQTTEMSFNPTHFKQDSSSSESDLFTEGLTFSKKQEPPTSPSKSTTTPKAEDSKKQMTTDLLSLSDEDDLADFEILEDTDIPT
ncbi:hypothetical protein JTE90_016373 [Oedothorax gibbosus]|uniref:RETREG1-3/ARL6IP-like N-terminal reticulon-homology domain-containing protein n=1 Tax=Oedothorax gibbosus TaxID=931172 RepID=A0AAV6U706_9ARAC|nr:hypothetical protein JTE90_016373 [Oedothorax gibbosus]